MATNSKAVIFFCALLFAMPVLAQVTAPAASGKDSISFAVVEKEAEYPGGNIAWTKYVQDNISRKLPEADAPVGKYTAIVKFAIGKNGLVSTVESQTKFGYGMEAEIERVINNSVRWEPATQNGKPVIAFRIQPITFLKQSTDFTIVTQEPYTLYANVDNEITVTAKKIAPENINISVTGGKVLPGTNGRFIVRFSKPGRTIIEITNSKKDDKLIGTASIEVKEK